jgi:hypothetical protein
VITRMTGLYDGMQSPPFLYDDSRLS